MDISCNFKLVFSSSSIHNTIIPFIIKLKINMKLHLQAILVLELDFTHQKLIGVYKVFLYDSQLEWCKKESCCQGYRFVITTSFYWQQLSFLDDSNWPSYRNTFHTPINFWWIKWFDCRGYASLTKLWRQTFFFRIMSTE